MLSAVVPQMAIYKQSSKKWSVYTGKFLNDKWRQRVNDQWRQKVSWYNCSRMTNGTKKRHKKWATICHHYCTKLRDNPIWKLYSLSNSPSVHVYFTISCNLIILENNRWISQTQLPSLVAAIFVVSTCRTMHGYYLSAKCRKYFKQVLQCIPMLV